MELGTHIQFFSNHMLDIVVLFRVMRIIFFLAAALLMLREPMMCGGRNSALHRLIAAFFAVSAFYSWDIAQTRMKLLTADPTHLLKYAPESGQLVGELLMTTSLILIVMKLGYDYTKWRAMKRLGANYERGRKKVCI